MRVRCVCNFKFVDMACFGTSFDSTAALVV